jgi:ATP-binding cassette subfamily C protein EexD
MLAVYDVVIPSGSVESLVFITILIVGLYLFWGLLQMVRSWILVRVNEHIDKVLRDKIFDVTLLSALKNPYRASNQPIQDFQQLKQFITGASIFAFLDAPWIPIYLAVLFIFHKYYGYWAVIVAIVIFILALLNDITTKYELEHTNLYQIKSANFVSKILSNVEVIKALGMRNNIRRRWLSLHEDFNSFLKRSSDKVAFWSNILKTLRVMFQSLIYGLGGYLAIKHEITGGMIVAGAILLGRVLAPIDLMLNTWKSFSSTRSAYKRLQNLLSQVELEERTVMKLPVPKGKVELANVYAVPPQGKEPVLKNVSFSVNPGELVAVLGPSGAGKSSLMRLIVGVWYPLRGEVMIDGADIKQWDSEYLGQFLGYLPQDVELFEGTVAENIARFSTINPDKVVEAAKLAGAHEAILRLPEGYNTYIGPGGITLSGGQRQRIGLARALYGNPKIVVLDEPNASLDVEGEKALLETLWKLKSMGTTTFVVSHKLNILELADRVLYLRDGMLSFFGPTDQFLKVVQGAD